METKDVVTEALKVGIRHFQAQNYETLLKVFTKAIELARNYDEQDLKDIGMVKYHSKLPVLLDSRALTFEKLRRYKQAGKDGEDLIELDPLDCKGYLRVCKILLLMDLKIEAYKVLSKGFKRVQAGIETGRKPSSLFQELKSRKNALALELKNERRKPSSDLPPVKRIKLQNLDPLQILPIEIFGIIISLLPFQYRGTLLLVSKNWTLSISKLPLLWDHVELRKPISSVLFKKLYNKVYEANETRFLKKMDNLKFLPRRNDEKQILNYILNLRRLQILNMEFILQDLSLKNLAAMVSSSKIARYNLHNLKSLKLKTNLSPYVDDFILQLLPNLTHLELIVEEWVDDGQRIEIEPIDSVLKLETLVVVGKNIERTMIPFAETLKSGRLVNLHRFIIAGFKFNSLQEINTPNLKELIVEQNYGYSFSDFINNNNNLSLNYLQFREFRVPKELELTYIPIELSLNFLSRLKFLDLTGSSLNYRCLVNILRLTDFNVEFLGIGACPNLVWSSSSLDRSTTRQFFINFEEVLSFVPNLSTLLLNQSTNLSNFTLSEIGRYLSGTFQNFYLTKLDLSFNNISGHGLIEFFQLQQSRIVVDELIVDGNDIKVETLEYLKSKNRIKSYQYDFSKRNWKRFGVNSYAL